MKKKVLGSLLACSLTYLSQSSYALIPPSQGFGMSSIISTLKEGHLVFQAGGYWGTQGKAQHIDIDGLIGDQFTVTKHSDGNGLIGLGYFIDGQDLSRFGLNYGVDAFYLTKTSVTGTVIQEDLFTNLSYDYYLVHSPIYLMARANADLPISPFSLTVDAGIGPNFMRAQGFTEHSLDGGFTIPDNAFSNHITTTFSATAGISLQLNNVASKIPLECGYRFFYLGQGRFTKVSDQIVNSLETGSAFANALICAVHV